MGTQSHLFSPHGWIVPDEGTMPISRASRVRIVEPVDGVIHTDSFWPQQTATIGAAMVIVCLGSIEHWLTPGQRFLTHARGFRELNAAYAYAAECTADQWNFLLKFPNNGASTVTRPHGLPIPDLAGEFPYLILDAWLDRFGYATLQWRADALHVLNAFQGLAGLAGGCMLRCAFKVDEDEVTTPIEACWLYACGRTDRMRWAIHPWPEKLPPPPVTPQ